MSDNTTKGGKVCPECGVALEGLDVIAHSLSHWPAYLDERNGSKLALKRKRQLESGGIPASDYRKEEKE